MPVAHSSSLCWIECLRMADEMAKGLGLAPKRDYAALAESVAARFAKEFYDETAATFGYDGTDAAAWALGIVADRDRLLDSLLKRLARRDYLMTTGIYSSPFLARTLLESGHRDVLFKVFFNPRHPSYRTILEDGFTTVPENLSSRLRVGLADKPQSSLNHPMHTGWLLP